MNVAGGYLAARRRGPAPATQKQNAMRQALRRRKLLEGGSRAMLEEAKPVGEPRCGSLEPTPDENAVHGTKAISRAILILRLVARQEILGVRLTQLTGLTGIPHPTIRRVLKCLMDERLVVQDAASRRYRLGPLTFELGLAAVQRPEFSKQLRPLLKRIAVATEDTTYLVVRSGMDTVCLDRIMGSYPAKSVTLEVGGRRPLGFGAASIALLAQCSDPEIGEVLKTNAREIEAHRRLNRDRILRLVAHTRERGYCLTRDMASLNTVGVGMAVPSSDGLPRFGISVSSTSERMNKDHIASVSRIMAAEIAKFPDVAKWPF